MLIACYNIYNEAAFLEESLESLRNKVDYIIVVDGAYKKFPHQIPWSTDGSIEIAKRYADEVIEIKQAWESQIVKRNQYLIGKAGDVYLIVDGHEIWQGDLRPPFGNFRIRMLMGDGWHCFSRMFLHQEGLRYFHRHYELWAGDRKLDTEFPEYQYGYFIHRDKVTEEREKAKEIYYKTSDKDN